MQLAPILKKIECRYCGCTDMVAYIEVESTALVFVSPKKTLTVYVNRGVFCNISCLNEYVAKMVKKGKK